MITKTTLAQMLQFFAADGKKHHIVYMEAIKHAELTREEDIDVNICFASNAACTKIVKGTLEFGRDYLVSRGEELGFGLKPDVVCKYSRNWSWDYCYLYKL
jgi:hypothetical protein